MTEFIIEDIKVTLEQKNIKNMYLKVLPPDGQVKVSAPKRMKQEQIERFVISRLAWIRGHREEMMKREVRREREFLTGEIILLFGEQYRLCVVETGKKQEVLKAGTEIYMYVKPGSTSEQKQKLLQAWYRERLRERIPRLIRKWEGIIGEPVKEWNVKHMKTRWGTCNPAARRIWFSLMLAEYPPECLEYIVVHEMVHLLERGHNARFYGYMDQFLPEWINIRQKLRENS